MTIYDMTYCAEDMNPCLFDLQSGGHPIKDPMDIDMSVFFDYLGQSYSFFDEQVSKFKEVGRFGDTINFIDLSPGLSLDEIANYFGGIESGSGGGVVGEMLAVIQNDIPHMGSTCLLKFCRGRICPDFDSVRITR